MPDTPNDHRAQTLTWHLPAPSARQVFVFRVLCAVLATVATAWWVSLMWDIFKGRMAVVAIPVSLTVLGLWALEVQRQVRHLLEALPIELHWVPAHDDFRAGWFTPQGTPARVQVLADIGPWLWLRCRIGGRWHWRLVSAEQLSPPLRWRLFHGKGQAVASSGHSDSESALVQSTRFPSTPGQGHPAEVASRRRRA
ncbi:hypothetical protein EYS42_04780 [Aquabacterium lacunae]|uniref:Uncharacterized protein n=1 Tax=Aquabacterium lacunae TaxID=2528630 RepID=A0A4Q9GZR2_9BURK|nr:hypothetical protein [Aquabacterium lacunae]TBO32509.1 hypothetical protein EYS42_04780 [Aquabacterium lacunae]